MDFTVAYLINQYPAPTHSFIRREILALERRGVRVCRFSQRQFRGPLPSPQDQDELRATRVILDIGIAKLFLHTLGVLATHPFRSIKTLAHAMLLGIDSQRGVLRHLGYFMQACVMLHWLRECGAEHVHAHFGTNAPMVAMLCHMLGGPAYSFTVHGPEDFWDAGKLHLREKIRRARFVVGISLYGIEQLRRWSDREAWEKLHLVRCGLDDELLRAEPTPIPEHPKLTCIGRLCKRKMQHVLVKAVAQLVKAGRQIQVTLIGEGPTRALIEKLIASENVTTSVRLLGCCSQEQVLGELADSRALVLPSSDEGLPVAIMEAFAMSRPVISTPVAGIPELVEPGVSGWLVPVGSVEALAVALVEVLDASPTELQQKGEAGRQRVYEMHNVDRSAAALAELFGHYSRAD